MSLYIGTGNNTADIVAGKVTRTRDQIMELIKSIFPIGSLYGTGDASFNPNTEFEGTTWELKTEMELTDGITTTNCFMWMRKS